MWTFKSTVVEHLRGSFELNTSGKTVSGSLPSQAHLSLCTDDTLKFLFATITTTVLFLNNGKKDNGEGSLATAAIPSHFGKCCVKTYLLV